MSNSKNTLSKAAVFAGLLTILLSTIMLKVFPSKADLPEGYKTPIIAFEFAKTEADVSYLVGNSDEATAVRQGMRDGHKWDMFFPFAYAGFLLLLLFQYVKKGERIALFALPIAVLIIPFDINENIKLLAIVDAAESNALNDTLFAKLIVATWLKWVSIAISVLVLSVLSFKDQRLLTGGFGMMYVALTIASLVSGSKPEIVEMMVISLTPFMLVAFVNQLKELKATGV